MTRAPHAPLALAVWAIALLPLGCDRPHPLEPSGTWGKGLDLNSDAGQPDTNLASIGPGVGGKYTMYAWGTDLQAELPMQPTGLRPPPGMPIRVVMRGEIWLDFTERHIDKVCYAATTPDDLQACIDTWTSMLIDPVRPLGPWGDRSDIRAGGWDGDPYPASLHVGWDGASAATTPDSLVSVLYGIAGQELWLGREGRPYYASRGDSLDVVWPVYENHAGFVVFLEADDGSRPATDSTPAQVAQLIMTRLGADSTSNGGSGVRFSVAGVDGQVPLDVEWFFVPDVIGSNQPTTVLASGEASLSPAIKAPVTRSPQQLMWRRLSSSSADRLADPTYSARSTMQIWVGAPANPQAGSRVSIAATTARWPAVQFDDLTAGPTYTAYTECAGLAACTVPEPAEPGSIVAIARLGDERWSAASRSGLNTEPEFKLTCTNAEQRGDEVTCEASFVPSRTFVPGLARVTAGDGLQSFVGGTMSSDGRTWTSSGPGVTHSTLTVQVHYGADLGLTAEASAEIDVGPRIWPVVEFTQLPKEERYWLGYYPTLIGKVKWGVFHPPEGDYQIVQWREVQTGPNAGLAYPLSPPTLRQPIVWIHSWLYPDTDGNTFFPDQDGIGPYGSTDLAGRPYCTQAGVIALRERVRLHEGSTGAESSHYGLYQRQFRDLGLAGRFEQHVIATGLPPEAKVAALKSVLAKFVADAQPGQDQFEFDEYGDPNAIYEWTGGCALDLDLQQ